MKSITLKNNFSTLLSLLIESTPDRLRHHFFKGITPIFKISNMSSEEPEKITNYKQHLEWCINYIRKNNYSVISLNDYLKHKANDTLPNKKHVVFTIDDGFEQHYDLITTLFHPYDIPVTCFVITDFLDQKLWPWDDQSRYILYRTQKNNINLILPDDSEFKLTEISSSPYKQLVRLRNKLKTLPQTHLYDWLSTLYNEADVEAPTNIPEQYTPMSWTQAQELINTGHGIAPHSKTHRILSQLSRDEAEEEITGSLTRTQSALNGSSTIFAYPTGSPADFNQKDIDILSKSKISYALSTEAAHDHPNSDNYKLPRFSLPDNRFDFVQYISYFERLKNLSISRN